jgi:transcriptional regulator with XRE-family HTH domain
MPTGKTRGKPKKVLSLSAMVSPHLAQNALKRIEARVKKAAECDTIAHQLGRQIQTLRLSAGLSGAELARGADISGSLLSRIERGITSPSIDTIDRIARRLGVAISKLFVDQLGRHDCSFVPAGAGLKVERIGATAGHGYELLGHPLSGNLFVEPYKVTLISSAKPCTSFQHTGVEFLHVLSGAMNYRYGDRTYALRQGDSLLFDASAMHGPESFEATPITYLSVVFNLRG